MRIKDTELDYCEADVVALDYYLGESCETKDQWAKRVWDNCKEYAETNGRGYPPEKAGFWQKIILKYGILHNLFGKKKMPSVYAQCPHCLWENKKRRRRAAMMKEFTSKECDKKLLDMENIKQDVINKHECNWDYSHGTAKVMEIRDNPKYNYKTATERHKIEKGKQEKLDKKVNLDRQLNVAKLKKKFDDETIAIIYPQGKKFLDAKETVTKVRRGKGAKR